MLWVIVLIVIAVLGLAMVVGYAVWLAHKTSDLFGEVRVLGQRLGQLGELAGGIRIPERELSPVPGSNTADQDRTSSATNDIV